MSLAVSFARFDIVRIRPVTGTDHGNPTYDYGEAATRTTLVGCIVEPVQSLEIQQNREAQYSSYRVMMDPQYDLRPTDHVEWQGTEYQVNGKVLYQPSPTGMLDHKTFIMDVWEG